jgi:alpha-glucuronidase
VDRAETPLPDPPPADGGRGPEGDRGQGKACERRGSRLAVAAAIATVLFAPLTARAETGYDAWLRHAPITDAATRARYDALPAVVVALGDSPLLSAARDEIIRTVRGALGRTLRIQASPPREPAIILGSLRALKATQPALAAALHAPDDLLDDAYVIKSIATPPRLIVAAANERGVLYGPLALARKMDLGESVAALDDKQVPYAPVRMLDHLSQ